MKFIKGESHWIGLTPFPEALNQQNQVFQRVKQNRQPCFLGMEHPLVLTLGLRSHRDPLIGFYEKLFPQVFLIRRGGHLVIHNPGQLVIYPIVPIRELGLSVRAYLTLLTEVTERLLSSFGIGTFRGKEPGLFTKGGKIAMFGVGIRQGVSCHGLCVNVTNDLEDFRKIPVCGVKDQPMDQMAFHIQPPSMETLFQSWVDCFTSTFSMGSIDFLDKIWKFPITTRSLGTVGSASP